MATWTFVKAGGAPTGSIEIDVGSTRFVIDDVSNTTITTTDPSTAADLKRVSVLTLQGVTGTFNAPPVVQTVVLVDGVLSVPTGSGTYTPVSTASLGTELGYAESATGMALTTSIADVPALSIGVTADNRPFYLRFGCMVQIAKGSDATVGDPVQVEVDIVDISGPTVVASGFVEAGIPASSIDLFPLHIFKRLSLAAGTAKTYKAQAKAPVLPAGTSAALLGNANYLLSLAAIAA